jgi:hypothetical protein
MKNKKIPPKLVATQIAFLKRFVWKRCRNKLSENEQNTILIEQFCLRIKIDSRAQGFSPDQAMEIARPHVTKWAPWYDVDSFAWKSRDKIKLLGAQNLGEAISLTEWEWYLCKPRRGGGGVTPIDKGKDIYVQAWMENARRQSAEKRNLKLQNERKDMRKILETEVRRLLNEGFSYGAIAERFQTERRKHPTAKGIHVWTRRHVFAFDPDRKDPDHKWLYELGLAREKRDAQIEKARRMIFAMHLEGDGYETIARVLNKRKIPSRMGGKWNKTMVKRELVRGTQEGTQNRPFPRPIIPRSKMVGERADKASQAADAVTRQEENIEGKGKVAKDQSLPRLAWSNPVLIEMAYTEPLRQLYRERVAEAA